MLGRPLDLIDGALLQHVDLVDAAQHDITAVDQLLWRGPGPRRPSGGGEKGSTTRTPSSLYDSTRFMISPQLWYMAGVPPLLHELDVLPLEGQDVPVVGPPAQESAGHVAADALHVHAGLVHGPGVVQNPVHGEVHQPLVELVVGEKQAVELAVIDQAARRC